MKNLGTTIAMSLTIILTISCVNKKNDDGLITTPSGLQYKILKEGIGKAVTKGQEVLIHEITKYRTDSLVFSSRDITGPIKILLGGNQVIKGVDEGIQGMQKGEVRKLIVPPSLSKRTGNITYPHPDSTLVYEIELIDIVQKKKSLRTEQAKIKIDTSKSTIKWSGFYALKFDKHFGTVKLNKSEWYLDNGIITGGQFYINMNTIMNTDGKYNELLVSHLKNKDFFETNVYPISKLEITKIVYTNHPKVDVAANLTIKGVTQPISFMGSLVSNEDGQRIFTSEFVINRTRWNIKYGSGSFYDNLGDDIISDEIEFNIKIYTE